MAGPGSDSVRVFVVVGSVPTVSILSPSDQFVLGTTVASPPLPVTVQGWVRDNRLLPGGQPVVTVSFNGSPVTASVSKETSVACLSPLHCWIYSATQEFLPPDGVFLSVEVQAQTGGGSAVRQVSGIVDFCDDSEEGCNRASLFQGCEQNRRCIAHSDGCSNPVFPGRKDDPTQGELGLTSTAFGRDETGLPEGAPTVFGQRRPIQLPCNRHDECYHQRCPQVQTRVGLVDDHHACDSRFYGDMFAVCRRAYPEALCPVGRVGVLHCPQWRAEKAACYTWARLYYDAVSAYSLSFLVPSLFPTIGLDHCVGCRTIE